jgi:uncharacterized protein (DUF2062 family)
VSFFRRPLERARALWTRAKNERASPRQIAWALALGAFVGCTPAVGFHGGIAVGAATLLRLNRLFAFLGSRVCSFFVYPWIVIAEVEIAHVLRTGNSIAISQRTAVEQAADLMLDWLLGCALVGCVLATLVGLLGYAWARRRGERRDAAIEPDQAGP